MKTATHRELVSTWLEKHFKGTPCLVFFHPLGEGDRPAKIAEQLYLSPEEIQEVLHADILCIQSKVETSVRHLNHLDQGTFGWVEVWDGVALIEHN